jgi:hypothetical protein
MHPYRRRRNTGLLWAMIPLAVAYASALYFLRRLTGTFTGDGILGVLLGLYICSHPAANVVDLIFFDRHTLHQLSSSWRGLAWIALNLLILFVGCAVVFVGTTRFTMVVPLRPHRLL